MVSAKSGHSEIYNVTKASEEGIGQQHAMLLLREAGIPCKPMTSIYVGCTAVLVTGPKSVQRRAAKILYGERR